MLADLLGSVAVIVSRALILNIKGTISNIYAIDSALGVVIRLLMVWNTPRLIHRVANVVLEGTLERIDLYEFCYRIEEVEGVTLIL